ncbi:hypothetical protein D0C36_04635 [Mucilaginibacter conchicola]|uniref:Uncharacterized protein n=1 Tax=Mucilaginibacter conchicola TaxID=2303333 RepID=A0A372NXI5_9SPHI|nr:hypothetical protein [Mucilaginibacter conchicola]RFZ94826.1 hypothetical protein D0C36_04635 [Mucilaginibacter conchicola]
MIVIRIKDPESGLITNIRIHPVNNFTFKAWVVMIPGGKNVLLFKKEGYWHIIPKNISQFYAEKIGDKLLKL